jgi:hypothetical protein
MLIAPWLAMAPANKKPFGTDGNSMTSNPADFSASATETIGAGGWAVEIA